MESTHLSENKSIFRRRILEGLKIFLWHSCLYIHCNMVALKLPTSVCFLCPLTPGRAWVNRHFPLLTYFCGDL